LDIDGRRGVLFNLFNCPDSSEYERLIASIKSDTQAIANGNKKNHPYVDNRYVSRLQELNADNPSFLDYLNAWLPEDLLVVKYKKNPSSNDFHDIASGSSDGQKATAILAFLLSHGEYPLIIDQPEDDLDNELITNLVVEQLHKNKASRQLIIATHNPNIVVNGIAELIISLKFINGQVQLDEAGSLSEKKVRDSVLSVMEGGEKAFEKRYRRINIGG
jgi:ATPase subunit of ABC transporter with duplicated ATPase domains